MVNLSIRKLSGSKKDRISIVTFNKYIKTSFNSLQKMLNQDYMYNPFAYLGHHNSYNNICSKANIAVIDVDTTNISIYSRHQILKDEGITSLIATTSDNTNLYKYRILIKLNKEVDKEEYRRLVKGIKENGLIPDMDTTSYKPSQKFFSYKNSLILHTIVAKELNVEDYILPKEEIKILELSNKETKLNFNKRFNSYKYARPGNRTATLLKVGFEMKELGYSYNQIAKYIDILNSSFLFPKDEESIKRRVLKFLKG